VATLMGKACNIKAAARLRELTMDAHGKYLKAKKQNETRWTSQFTMVTRYFRIREELETVEGLEEFALSKQEYRILKSVEADFEMFNGMTIALQEKGCPLSFCREQFDIILKHDRYACMSEYLDKDSDIVVSPDFESGVCKISKGRERLNDEEANVCYKLKIVADEGADDTASPTTPRQSAPKDVKAMLEDSRKKRKLDEAFGATCALHKGNPEYVDVEKLICCTSNACERLFSEAKYIMVPHRRNMSPVVFEALLFLKKNDRFWNPYTVGVAMRKTNDSNSFYKQVERDDDLYYDLEEDTNTNEGTVLVGF